MASCATCGSLILFGGVRDGDLRFCKDECHAQGFLIAVARDVPEGALLQSVSRLRNGPCPQCQGPGPVDVHTAHKVFSVLVMTSWKSEPRVCCRSCGRKAQGFAMLYSLIAGWWGFPWGLVMTPVQVVRNLIALAHDPGAEGPSELMRQTVRLELAAAAIEMSQREEAAEALP